MRSVNDIQSGLILKPQECNGNFKFNGQLVITRAFILELGELSSEIAFNALVKVINERVHSPEGTDYLQVLSYEGTTFWIIDDVNVVTVLLPEDY